MSKVRVVKLGDEDFPIGSFNLRQVSTLSMLLRPLSVIDTQQKVDAQQTVIYMGLQTGGYTAKYEDFQEFQNVTAGQMLAAQLEIGRAIGYYSEVASVSDEVPAAQTEKSEQAAA